MNLFLTYIISVGTNIKTIIIPLFIYLKHSKDPTVHFEHVICANLLILHD